MAVAGTCYGSRQYRWSMVVRTGGR